MSRVQAPLVAPIFSLQKISKNLSISNSVEPASAGLDELFPVLGTTRDTGGPKLAAIGYHLAATFPEPNKAPHQINHLKPEISKGQRPPCNLLVFLVYRGLACSLSLLTTRPQRVMAGGQQQSCTSATQTKGNNLQGGLNNPIIERSHRRCARRKKCN